MQGRGWCTCASARHAHCGPDAEVASACSSTVELLAAWTLELLERCPRMISRTVRTEHTFLVSGWYSIYLQYCTPTVDARAEAPGWPGRAGGGRGGAGGGPRAGRGARESRRETRHEFNRVPLIHLYKGTPGACVHRCSGGATQRARHAPSSRQSGSPAAAGAVAGPGGRAPALVRVARRRTGRTGAGRYARRTST